MEGSVARAVAARRTNGIGFGQVNWLLEGDWLDGVLKAEPRKSSPIVLFGWR